MTYNVFGGTLNLAQSVLQVNLVVYVQVCVCVFICLLTYLLTVIGHFKTAKAALAYRQL